MAKHRSKQKSIDVVPVYGRLSFVKRLFSFFLATHLAIFPIFADAAELTAGATVPLINRPIIDTAPNGVPLINIVAPNASALSHNKYDAFNVGVPGLIFNNTRQDTSISQLGGLVQGNTNLTATGPARVILNEVIGNTPSSLLGHLEVNGAKADVIIANPSGLTCNGCGFINTSRVTLSTGTPEIGNDGALAKLSVQGGNFSIGRNGADLTQSEQLDLVARTIQLDGSVKVRDRLSVIAGANQYGYKDGQITPLPSDGKEPAVAIDSTLFGGMNAGQITIVSTDKGAGVKLAGQMAASSGEIHLTADGRLEIGPAQAKGKITAKSVSGDIAVNNTSYSESTIVLDARNGVILADHAVLASQSDLSIRSDTIALGNQSQMASGIDPDGHQNQQGKLTLSANQITIGKGQVSSSDTLSITSLLLDLSRDVDSGTLSLQSLADLNISAQTVNAQRGRVAAIGRLTIGSDAALAINGGDFETSDLLLVDAASVSTSAILGSKKAVSVNASNGTLEQAGTIIGDEGVTLVATGALALSGQISSKALVDVSSGSNLSIANSGTIIGDGGVRVASASGIENNGQIGSAQTINLTGTAIHNGASSLLTGDAGVTITASSTLSNEGQIGSKARVNLSSQDALSTTNGSRIIGDGGVTISSNRAIDNEGQIGSAGTISVTGADITNGQMAVVLADQGVTFTASGALTNSGQIGSKATIGLTSNGALSNTQTGTILGNGGVTATSQSTLNNYGQLASTNAVTLSGTDITNGSNAVVIADGGVTVNASGSFTSLGHIGSKSTINLLAGGQFSGGGQSVIVGEGGVTLTSDASISNNGQIGSTNKIRIAGKAINNGTSAKLIADAGVTLQADGALSNQGQIGSKSAINLSTTSTFSNLQTGSIVGDGGVTVTSAGGLENDGQIGSAKTINLTGTAVHNGASALIMGDAGVTATASSTFNNEGQIGSKARIALSSQDALSTTNSSRIIGDGGVTLSSNRAIDNEGQIGSAGALTVTGTDITNGQTAVVIADQGATFTASGALTNSGQIGSKATVALSSGHAFTNVESGTILGNGGVTATSQSTLNNQGQMASTNAVTLSGTDITNGANAIMVGDGGVTVNANGQLVNAGQIGSQAGINLTANTALANQAGAKIVGNGSVSASAGTALSNSGQIGSKSKITLSSNADFTNAASAAIIGDGGIETTAGGRATNAGSMQSAGLLSVKGTDIGNASGATLLGDGGTTILASGTFANSGTVASKAKIALTSGSTFTNAQGAKIAGDGGVTASATGALSNSGTIGSTSSVALTSTSSSITNSSTAHVIGNSGVTLNAATTLANDGEIGSAGAIALGGTDISNTAAAKIVAGANGVGGTPALSVTGTSLTNAGAFGATSGDVATRLAGSLTNTGILYAGGSASYRLDGALTNYGDIYAENSIALAGNSKTRMAGLYNISGTVEAVSGSLSIDADTLENRRNGDANFTTTTTTSTVATGNPTITQTVTTDQGNITGTAAKLLSGGNMLINAGSVLNRYSQISSNGNLTINAGSVTNEGRDLIQKTDTTTVTHHSEEYCSWDMGWLGCWGWSTKEWDTTDYATSSQTIGAVYGTITASGALTANVTGYVNNNAVRGSAGQTGLGSGNLALKAGSAATAATSAATGTAAQTGTAATGATQSQQSATATGATTSQTGTAASASTTAAASTGASTINVTVDGITANRGLFVTVSDPNSPYVIETRREFIDLSKFLGSDYFLSRAGNYNPDLALKRLGDAYVEYRIIRDQMFDLTGSRLGAGSGFDEKAYVQALYDNALGQQGALKLTVGISLSADQVAALTKDIVWMEKQTVNGREVLVPKVYLASATRNAIGRDSARIAGDTVNITTAAITNSGAISARSDMALTAGMILNNGGLLSAGGAMAIDSGALFSNQSGRVYGRSIAITADQIFNDTLKITDTRANGSTDRIQDIGQIRAIDGLTLNAGSGLSSIGGSFAAGGTLKLSSGGSIDLGALTISRSRYDTIDGGHDAASSSVNTQASLQAGSNLTLDSGKAITLQGVEAKAGGDLTLTAKEGVSLQAVQDQTSSDLKLEMGSSGLFSSKTEISRQSNEVTTKATTLEAGGAIAVQTTKGDVTLEASKLTSGTTTTLAAEQGKVVLNTAKDSSYKEDFKHSESLLWYSQSDKGHETETIRHVEITAGGGLKITAGQGVVVEYKPTGSLDQSITQLAQAPGLAYLKDLRNDRRVNFQAVDAVYKQWDYQSQGLTQAGAALLTLIVAAATGGAGGLTSSLSGSISGSLGVSGNAVMSAAITAGTQTLINQSVIALVNNQGDLGKALQELGSSGNIRSLLTSMVSAGLVTGAVNLAGLDKTLPASATTLEKVSQDLQRGLVTATVKASVQAAIQGGRFDETLISALRLEGATVLGNAVATEIGSAYHAGDLPKAAQLIAHAALGCAEGAIASGDCGAGAIGGVAGEVAAEVMINRWMSLQAASITDPNRVWTPAELQAEAARMQTELGVMKAQGGDIARLAAGLAAAAIGKDVDTAANAGGVAANKNALALAGGGILLTGVEGGAVAACIASVACALVVVSVTVISGVIVYKIGVAGSTTVANTPADDGKTPGIGHNGGPPLDDPSTGGPKDPKDKPPTDPKTVAALAAAKQAAEKAGWKDSTGKDIYPPNDGFAQPPQKSTLQPGTRIDRYGDNPNAEYFSPEGTPFEARSLPPDAKSRDLVTYEVVKPIPTNSGPIASWFGQQGGGTQFKTNMTLQQLLDGKYIKEISRK